LRVYAQMNNSNLSMEECLRDVKRVEYMSSHLDSLLTAMR